MSAATVVQPTTRRPGAVVGVQTSRQAGRSALLWGAVFALYVAASALGYASAYPTQAERDRLAQSLGSNPAVSAIIGPAHAIDTVAGFTAWRTLGVLSIAGAVWGLLLGTKLLRGEEDAGRWEHLLSGRTTRRRAAAQALVGLGIGIVVLWAIPAVAAVAVGRSSKVGVGAGPALFLALSLVCSAAMFLALGALASQLAPTRRQAAAWCGAVLGVAYGLRMVADSGVGLDWLRWLTPLGWVEQLRPLAGDEVAPLVPILALIAAAVVATVELAGRRDLGASTMPDRQDARARTALLGGPTRLGVRLTRPVALAWAAGAVVWGLLLGSIAKSAGESLAGNSTISSIVSKLGAAGASAKVYLGLAFLIIATMVSLVAAVQAGATRAEESSGRLDHILVRPYSRTAWFTGRLAIALALVAAVGLAAGLGTWIGAALQNSSLGLPSLLGASLNVLPPGVLVVGVGALAMGFWPRGTALAAYGVVAWSFLVELIGGVVNANHWLLDLSILHHMSAAPAIAPDWGRNAVVLALGAAAMVVGGIGFARRDLAGD
ncbi:MAG TPA: ABC transporter permease subunit [Actinomycetes bacterium]|nr:ABC transporter permease subunit [Actinomycetes bacterium]